MDDGVRKFISNSSWFKNLPASVTAQLAEDVTQHFLNKGEALIKIGDMGDSVFVLRSGWVKIVIPDDKDGEVVLNHLGPGEFVGELSLIDQKPRSASVIALSEVEALELKREDFLDTLNAYPMLGLYVITNISSRMRYMVTYLDKAIHWSYKIAEGDYSFAAEEISKAQNTAIVDNTRPDDTRANRFLLAFFQMVEGVQKREQLLIEKLRELTIKIDVDKRDQELASLTGTAFFEKLQSDTQSIRRSRTKKRRKKKR